MRLEKVNKKENKSRFKNRISQKAKLNGPQEDDTSKHQK